MTITRKDIFDKVNFFCKKENRFFASSDLLTIINRDAMKRIAEDVMYPKANYSGYLSSGTYLVSAPVDFLKVDSNSQIVFQDYTGVHKLYPKEKQDIGYDSILTSISTPTSPTEYYMETESIIGIYPPCTSGNFVIPYVKRPTALSSDADTNEITERCYMAAVYWTLTECMIADTDERSIFYEQKYQTEIARLKDQYRRGFEITRDYRPNKDYVKRPSGT